MATPIPQNEAAFVLGEIAATCSGRIDPACAGKRVHGVVTDSRAVQPGQLYVALRGEHHDGHKFLAQALAQGACAALVERVDQVPAGLPAVVVADTRRALGELAALHRARWGKTVVAITGSAGKTTTKELTAAALTALGHHVLRTQGNLNNEIGVPMTLFGLTSAHDVAVVELGTSGPGEIARLAQIARADVGVVTTVSLAHTAGLGSLADVADEKCALLRGLGKDGVAIYSADSESLRKRSAGFAARRVISFGEHASALVQLVKHAVRADLTTAATYKVSGRQAPLEVVLGLCGFGPALDAAAALAVVLALHTQAQLEPAALGLPSVAPAAGRLLPVAGPGGSLVIDDTYNANPASMAASLHTLSTLARVRGGRSIAALADMAELGEHSRAEHERVGREVVRLGLSAVFLCGQQMQHAAAAARDEAAASHASVVPRIEHFSDPLDCIAPLSELLSGPTSSTDAVLVKGSRSLGMERVVQAICGAQGRGA
ncbi:MAG TPA: UDP-N-acetylmuramoyl-tripeptide--D-alanyl-D-alanine ligase [Polyangiales bacterium]